MDTTAADEREQRDTTDREYRPGRALKKESLILHMAGDQLDDPDPVRVARWIHRLKGEGLL